MIQGLRPEPARPERDDGRARHPFGLGIAFHLPQWELRKASLRSGSAVRRSRVKVGPGLAERAVFLRYSQLQAIDIIDLDFLESARRINPRIGGCGSRRATRCGSTFGFRWASAPVLPMPYVAFVALRARRRATNPALGEELRDALKRTLRLSPIGVPRPVQGSGPVRARK
jgi:hypothetical protein